MKYNFDFKDNDYKTPPELYRKALDRWCLIQFALDTCCSDKHIPADIHYIYGENDGLLETWYNYSWCNPPFNECDKWVAKAFRENELKGYNICMLLPVRTETKYWHKYILGNPNVTIEWLRKGYKFLNKNNEEMGVFKNALALVYFE